LGEGGTAGGRGRSETPARRIQRRDLTVIAPGTIVGGDFRILEPLSEGGMGAVFVAEQISTGRRRAVKLMKRELVADSQLRARFTLEAKAGAQIASEHVVEVLAAGVTDEGQPWLAMELLSGVSLHDLVTKRGGLDLPDARTIIAHVCHAMAAAHRVSIVHRDLKPENVFIANSQREGGTFVAKVLDFGIAKVVADSQSAGFSQTASIGTPLWMAPEQADPRGVITPATDLWPLGLIAFFMLTGKAYWLVAHTNASIAALVREIAIEPLALASVRAAELGVTGRLPTGFDAWFARCVHRNPTERFGTVDAAKDAFFALQPTASDRTASLGQSPLARSAPLREGDAFAPTAALAATPAIAAASRSAPVVAPKRSSTMTRLVGGSAMVIIVVLVGFVASRLVTSKKTDGSNRISEAEVSQILRRADFNVPATGGRAGDLLRLDKTDAWWGAELPLVTIVFFCSLTAPTCAVTTRELDTLVADRELHAQVRWRHAVRPSDASAKLAAEAAQGAFERGGTRAFLRFRDLAFAHRGPITIDEVSGWAKQIGVDDPDDYVIRLKRGEWKERVDADVTAYAAARIGSPGFVWANCEPRGLTVGYAGNLRDDAARFLVERPRGHLELGNVYIERCKPSERRMLGLADVEISPFAAVGSSEWAKKIAIDWAASLSMRDVTTLTRTYAPRVAIAGKGVSRAEAIDTKRARFAKDPDLRFAISGSIRVSPSEDGYVVELTRAERSSRLSQTLRTTLVIRASSDGWAIVEESAVDETSCAGALVAAALDTLAVDVGDAGDHERNGLTVVEHDLEGSRAKVTVRKLIDGRSFATRDLAWDLAPGSGAASSDAAHAAPATVQRACSAK
jgi:serine/threonine protein kinase